MLKITKLLIALSIAAFAVIWAFAADAKMDKKLSAALAAAAAKADARADKYAAHPTAAAALTT